MDKKQSITVYVKPNMDTSELDEVKAKVEELNEALEKANCLLNQLADREEITLKLNFVVDHD